MKKLLAFLALFFYYGCATVPPSKSTIQKAEEEYLKGNYSLAISNYQGYLNENSSGSDQAEANYRIGICYQKLNDLNNAILYLEKALTATDDKVRVLTIKYVLAEAAFIKADFDKAMQNYQALYIAEPKLLSQVAKRDSVVYSLAVSMLRNTKWEDGRSLLRKFVAEFPNSNKTENAKIILAINESKFFVQLGIFNNKVNAERNIRELSVKGLKASIRELSLGLTKTNLVIGGNFQDWQSAQKEVEKLKALGITAYTLP